MQIDGRSALLCLSALVRRVTAVAVLPLPWRLANPCSILTVSPTGSSSLAANANRPPPVQTATVHTASSLCCSRHACS